MNKSIARLAPALALAAFLGTAPAAASPAVPSDAGPSGASVTEERFKAALDGMVRAAEAAPDAASRRTHLIRFADRMERGLRDASTSGSLKSDDRASLGALSARFHAYGAELRGAEGFSPVADADLSAFARYVQQDLEQAPVGGGIYISGGALLVILILLLLLWD